MLFLDSYVYNFKLIQNNLTTATGVDAHKNNFSNIVSLFQYLKHVCFILNQVEKYKILGNKTLAYKRTR